MDYQDEENAQLAEYLSQNQPSDLDSESLAMESAPSIAPIDDASKEAAIKSYLTPQYSSVKDDAAIQAAKTQADKTNFIANIGQALGNLATATSRAHGGRGVDESLYQGIKQQGQQGVNQAISAKQNNVADFMRNHQLERQMAQDKMTHGTYEEKMAAAKIKALQADPASEPSMRAVKAAQSTFPERAKTFEGLSANEVASALKGVEVKDKIDSNKIYKDSLLKRDQDVASERKNAADKKTAEKDFENLGKDLDADLATSRSGIGQANSKIQGATRVMTFADVTPEELERSTKDPALMNQLKSKLDNLTPQQYTEVVTGLMSQVAPGTGSLGQLEHLRANTAEQTAANLKQYFTSETAPANMGQMLLNNLLTLKNEQDTSKAVIGEHVSKMESKHPHAFAHEDTKDLAKKLLGRYQTSTTQQAANNDPNQAMKWAKDNPTDPRAKQILERLGTMNAGL